MFGDIAFVIQDHTPLFFFFLVLFIEAGVPIPIPYDILLLVAGYQQLPFLPILTAVVLGNIIGSSLLFSLAWRFGDKIESRALKFFGIPARQAQKAENWFKRWGKVAIIIARIIPGARFGTTFLAGSLRIPYLRVFLPYLSVGSILWVTLYWNAGAMVGEYVHYLVQFISAWLLILPLSLFGVLVYIFYNKTKQKK